MPRFLLVRLRPVWGYAVRALPQSKTRVSLGVPPPTTLIGALAYPLARVLGDRVETIYSEGKRGRPVAVSKWSEEVRRRLLYVGASLGVASVAHGSILKIQYFHRGEVLRGIAAMPVEVTAGSESWIDVAYVFEEVPWEWSNIERAAWGISRLGSRESVAYVEGVWSGVTEAEEAEGVETRFTVYGARRVSGDFRLSYVVDWRRSGVGGYLEAERVAAVYPLGRVRVEGRLNVFRMELPWGVERVVGFEG